MNKPPKLSFACPIPWSKMKGSDVSRVCETCGHHIHNLSSLTPDQRAAILKRASAEKICGSYLVRLTGELVTPESPLSRKEARGIRQVGIAALSAAALALVTGCLAHAPERNVGSTQRPKEQVEAKAGSENEEEIVQLVGFIITPEEAAQAAKQPNKK